MSAELDQVRSEILDKLKEFEEKKAQAEKSRDDYLKLRDNILARISEVEAEIETHSKQIAAGHKAINDLETIYKREAALREEEARSKEGEEEEDPFTTEDGLPMMEIYEELDDDGNIIGGCIA